MNIYVIYFNIFILGIDIRGTLCRYYNIQCSSDTKCAIWTL